MREVTAEKMKKQFLIKTEVLPDISAAVFASGVVSPFEQLSLVEKDLKRKKVQGLVVFDLLLANGTKANRYFSAFFDGNHFEASQIRKLSPVTQKLQEVSAIVYKENIKHIDSTLLSGAMKFALKQGTVF